MRYLIYGYYGYGNFGDDLLLRALVDGIACREREASFTVLSFDIAPGFEADSQVQFARLAPLLENVRAKPWRLLHYLAALTRRIGRSDVLVIGGGALFTDKGRFSLSLALICGAAFYARMRRRRVVIVGVAVDRLQHPVNRWLTRRTFASADFIAVREKPSLQFVPRRAAARARLSADLALGLDWDAAPKALPRPRRVVGLCFIDYFRTVEPSIEGHAAYEAAIFGLIERHRRSYSFVAVTLQRGRGQRDDWLSGTLAARYGIPTVHVQDIRSARDMAAEVDIIVTTRFHLGLLGILWGKSTIVIDHELKMACLAEAFALPSISLRAFLSEGGLDLDALLSHCDPARTAALIEAERARAPLNFAWLDERGAG